MNKKAFQAVLSSRESDRESFSIGDCYVKQYKNPKGIQVPGSISFKRLLKEAWKIASSIFKMADKFSYEKYSLKRRKQLAYIDCLVRAIM